MSDIGSISSASSSVSQRFIGIMGILLSDNAAFVVMQTAASTTSSFNPSTFPSTLDTEKLQIKNKHNSQHQMGNISHQQQQGMFLLQYYER